MIILPQAPLQICTIEAFVAALEDAELSFTVVSGTCMIIPPQAPLQIKY
jgi:hypothetical protein